MEIVLQCRLKLEASLGLLAILVISPGMLGPSDVAVNICAMCRVDLQGVKLCAKFAAGAKARLVSCKLSRPTFHRMRVVGSQVVGNKAWETGSIESSSCPRQLALRSVLVAQ